MNTLVIAEHDNQTIADATKKALSAAIALGNEVHLLVAGENCADAVADAANIDGIAKVLKADNAAFAKLLAEPLADLVVSLADGYSAIITAATTNGKNFMPRIAALLDMPQLSDITAVIDANTFERPIYAGNAIQTVKVSSPIKIMTVRATAFPLVGEGGSASIEDLTSTGDKGISEYVGEELTVSDRPELTSAKIVISGGRGMQSGDNFTILESVADKLGAAVGASRAAVDAGFVPNDYQVGQTGKVVAPELYIAVGISGAIQHLAGMKDSKVIVAINKDEEAPIFQVADYGLVADLFTAVPELDSALGNA
ncbi:MAG: FAD-binding protein [Pseudomonadota bacterium]|nr:FAD-binding protein [Pseudomonadota bacterium]